MESHKLDYELLKKYISDRQDEYVIEEDDVNIVITFVPMIDSMKQRLGESSVRLCGLKKGKIVELTKLVMVEENNLSEISIDTLAGWTDYINNI